MSKKGRKAKERLRAKKERQKKVFFGVVGAVVALMIISIIVVLQVTGGGGDSVIDAGEAPEDAKVSKNLEYTYVKTQDINDEKLHFYQYYSNNKVVRYFIVMGTDGKYHAAIDLCQKLHPARSGWRQDGYNIVCKDELCAYPINAIGTEQPGCCWPVTLPFEIVGNEFQIRTADLETAAAYF